MLSVERFILGHLGHFIRRWALVISLLPLLVICGISEGRTLTPGGSGDTLFPVPPGIQPNVKFWRDVFSRYKTSEVIYHDEVRVDRIYEVSELGKPWISDNAQKRMLRRRENTIRKILTSIANNRTPPPGEERLVARLRKMFAGKSRSEILRAASRIRSQPGLKERFRESYVRSGRYLSHFQRIFKKYGIPSELTLLPHVESGFRKSISSHAGASGMWQFTRSTGRLFMRVDRTIDGRRDPYISADAAARLFKRNYEDLKTWPLAITAYNHGATGMRRAVRKLGSKDIGVIARKYNSRTFGFASRNFYASFIAAVQVHKNAKKYFANVLPDSSEKFGVFHLPGYIRIYELSQRIGIDRKLLREMNPALRPSVLRGGRRIPRGYPLRVPLTEIARVRESYFRDSSKVAASKMDENAKWVWVRSGDTLGRIARRYRVSLKNLKRENELTGNLIVVGDRLRIPQNDRLRKSKVVAENKAEPRPVKKAKKAQKPMRVTKAETSAKPGDEIAEAVSKKRSESLVRNSSQIVSAVAPDEGDFWETEDLELATILPERGSQIRREGLRHLLAVRTSNKGKVGWVRVHENETIGHYSRWLRISTRVIRRMNKIRSNRRVRVGKKIRVPLQRVSKENFLEKRVSFHLEIEKEFLRKYSVLRTDRHVLKRGENVWTLVMQTYKVPLWLFKQYNAQKNLHQIAVGEELVFPVLKRRSF